MVESGPELVFLLSQPRAGSTLLQRLLVRHPAIASTPEPWVLLPLLAFEEEGLEVAVYSSETARLAIGEFVSCLPEGRATWSRHIRAYARGLYGEHCVRGERYFLDKTPRYALIARALADHFPEARFIYLRRHPLQTLASILETFCEGRLAGLFRYHIDVFEIPDRLASVLPRLEGRLLEVDYDALVNNPRDVLQKAYRFLGVDPEMASASEDLDDSLRGVMGDPTGFDRYRSVRTDSLELWRGRLRGRVRRYLSRSVIEAVSEENWRALGHEQAELLRDVDRLPVDRSLLEEIRDASDLLYSELRRLTNAHLFVTARRRWFRKRFFT